MATQDNNSLEAKINAIGLRINSDVLASLDPTAAVTTASRQLWVDSNSRLASGIKQPFALGATQSTITDALFTISGKASTDVLTQTLVGGASVTTATKALFVRVSVTDDNSVVTAGDYYLQLFTIT